MENKITKVQKRNKELTDFDQSRITRAIFKALTAADQGSGEESKKLSDKVVEILNRRFKPHGRTSSLRGEKEEIPQVEQIQDIIEEVLILENLVETAKAYILYREQRRRVRDAVKVSDESIDKVDQYLEKLDWEVKENANMAFSLQGLNYYGSSYIIKKYWLNKIYPKEIREANESGDFHIHDLSCLAPYTFFGREVVIAKLDEQIKLISLKDLYEELSQREVLLNEKDEAFAKYPKNLYVLDKNDWTRVSRMVRKKREREMRFIKSEQGRSIIVTDNHPFIVKNGKKELEIEAKKVKEKKDLAYSVFIPDLLKSEHLFSKKYLYLAEELLQKQHRDFFLEGFEWQDFIENWGGSLKAQGTLSTSNSANSLNNKLELTEDFGYLVGIFIAEGSYNSWRLEITNNDERIIKKIQKICAGLGIKSYINEHGENTKRVSINSSTLKLVFEKVFEIRDLSQNKNLPLDILNYNLDFIKGVIAGIIDGDGGVDPDNNAHGASQILIRVSSRTMLEQIAVLLQFLGFISRDRAIEGIGTKRIFRGREIIQNFPLYGISFSKKNNIDLPSFKYKKAKPAQKHWRVEDYGWNKVLNNKFTTIPDDTIYDITTESSTFLANGLLVHNCMGWDLYDFLIKGFGGVSGKMEAKPPKHFKVALGQAVNFLFTAQGECCGAIAFSNFDTLLAPFIRYDNLNYQQVKQALQEFLFNMAVPTRVGFQNPFSNITLDLKPSPVFAEQSIIIGGKPQKEAYGEFEEEMKTFNRALYEVYMEGDKNARPFSFPIPTINITEDFPWDEPAFNGIFEATAKYGINYFANYINSEMKPEDVRSMCCRLRLDMTELHNRGGGGLFGSGSLTGSLGVVTINMPRIGYLSKTKKEFLKRLGRIMDIARESLEIKRKIVENFMEKGLYPYSRYYLSGIKRARNAYFANHFSTIGLVGMNEALLNFIGEDIGSRRGRKFGLEIMDFMRDRLKKYQNETGNIYNLEQSPSESTAFRLAQKDKKKYPDIIVAGTKKAPYYTNSSQLPVNYTTDIFEALKLQDEITCKYTGGSVFHIFLGEQISDVSTVKSLIKRVFQNFRLPYITITPTFCYDKKTEVLTKNGWKFMKDVEIGEEMITANPETRELSYQKVIRKFEYDYKGKMVHFKARKKGFDCLVTPNHRMFIEPKAIRVRDSKGKFKNPGKYKYFELAEEVKSNTKVPLGGFIWKGKRKEFFILPPSVNGKKSILKAPIKKDIKNGLTNKEISAKYNCSPSLVSLMRHNKRGLVEDFKEAKIPMDTWLKFFGIWLAEGNARIRPEKGGGEVYVAQRNKKIRREIENVLKKLPFDYTKEERGFHIYSLQLASYLSQFSGSKKKYIPTELKQLSRGQLEILINWHFKGDGTKGSNYSASVSPRLRDDLQELYLKIGYHASVRKYIITKRTTKYAYIGYYKKEVNYDGKIYDIEVQRNHVIYVRRNGFPVFSSNSICPVHGYLSGEHFECPKCLVKQPCEVYTRVVGYLRPVKQFNTGKQQEFEERKEFKIKI